MPEQTVIAHKQVTSPSDSSRSHTRQSNFEMLRIVSMMLVLVLHADFLSLGIPKANDFYTDPTNAWTRTLLEMAAICAVNVFVMISGWFGIRATVKGAARFLFQVFFFYFGIYALMLIAGEAELTQKNILECVKTDWFTLSYMALFILSPALNVFAERASTRQFATLLIGFFLLQTIYGWESFDPQYRDGYSALSFIGLYLLARFMSRHPRRFFRSALPVFIACVIIDALLLYALRDSVFQTKAFAYNSPLVILQAAALVAFVSTVKMRTVRIINFLAASAYAVYLLHINDFVLVNYFKATVLEIYNNNSGIACLALILTFLIAVYLAAVVIDQLRKLLWTAITVGLQSLRHPKSQSDVSEAVTD